MDCVSIYFEYVVVCLTIYLYENHCLTLRANFSIILSGTLIRYSGCDFFSGGGGGGGGSNIF